LAETRSMTEEEGLAMLAAREAGWQHDLGG